jgi:hypothetical protein
MLIGVERSLGSRTSGVDGASEGGRINTIRLPGALMIYAIPLLNEIKSRGSKVKATAEPVQVDGIWCLKLRFEGDPGVEVPERWHGHRVIVEKVPPKDG